MLWNLLQTQITVNSYFLKFPLNLFLSQSLDSGEIVINKPTQGIFRLPLKFYLKKRMRKKEKKVRKALSENY